MCTLTTKHGVTWQILTINDRTAYQADSFLVFHNPKIDQHVLVDGFAKVRMTGTVMDCLEVVQQSRGMAHTMFARAVA